MENSTAQIEVEDVTVEKAIQKALKTLKAKEHEVSVKVLKEGHKIEKDTIRDYVKQHVAPYKYPRVIQIRKEPLPKSGTGKILKKEIRDSIE